jgi:hypothetical protein
MSYYRGNIGYGHKKLIIELNKPEYFPWERGTYDIGVQCMELNNLGEEGTVKLVNICVSPKVSTTTYLPNKIPVPSIKSCFVKENNEIVKFSENIEFFEINLNGTDILKFYITDIGGNILEYVSGTLVLNVRKSYVNK